MEAEKRTQEEKRHSTAKGEGVQQKKTVGGQKNAQAAPLSTHQLYEFAFFEYRESAFDDLFRICKPENWDYADTPDSNTRHLALRSYVENTFVKLQADDHREKGRYIEVAPNGAYAAFNTGLFDVRDNEIYALFRKMPSGYAVKWMTHRPKQPWLFMGFCSNDYMGEVGDPKSNYGILRANFDPLPPRADYFKKLKDAVFDYRKNIDFGMSHIIKDNIGRFPLSYLRSCFADDPRKLKIIDKAEKHKVHSEAYEEEMVKLAGAVSGLAFDRMAADIKRAALESRKMARDNYTVAVPLVHTASSAHGSMGFMLPLYLGGNAEEPSVVLVLRDDKRDPAHRYAAATVLTPTMACRDARLIAKPMANWVSAIAARRDNSFETEGTQEFTEQSVDESASGVKHESEIETETALPVETANLVGDGVDIVLRSGDTIGCRRDPNRAFPAHSLGMSASGGKDDIGGASQIHGRFTCENGTWLFTDDSTNGTKVIKNGSEEEVPLEKGRPFALQEGDKLIFANFRPLVFYLVERFESKSGNTPVVKKYKTPKLESKPEEYKTPKLEPKPIPPQKPKAFLKNGLIGFSCEVYDGSVVGVMRRDVPAPGHTLVLPDIVLDVAAGFKYVSQDHGRFSYGDGKWVFESHGKNGTTVTRGLDMPRRLVAGERFTLENGDALSFAGGPVLSFSAISSSHVENDKE